MTRYLRFQKEDAPTMIIAGCGAFDILNSNLSDSKNLYTSYSSGLIKLVQPADVLAKKGTQFLWMLQDPIVKENLPAHFASIDNNLINICNKAAVEVFFQFFSILKNNNF